MRKIIHTLKYGETKTKRLLLLTIASGLAIPGCLIGAILLQNLLLYFATVIAVFVTISLVQTFGIHDTSLSKETQTEKTQTEKNAFTKNGKRKQQKKTDATVDAKSDIKSYDRASEAVQKIYENTGIKQDELNSQDELEGQDEWNPFNEPDERDTPTISMISEEEVETYNKRKIKKLLYKFKVKKDHRLVLVDHCDKLKIKQTPAYIWVADNAFHLLLIEQEPRHISIPIFNIQEITYLKKQPANEDIDYGLFKRKSILTELFRPYLPDYSHSTVVDDLTAYKNLYGVGPGIYFTNRSAKSLFDLLGVDLYVEDKVTKSQKVNVFFKDAYKANIMLRDNVIDANGYADRISTILNAMANSTISYGEFKDTLNLMQKNKLITSEFAMYYMGVRDKING